MLESYNAMLPLVRILNTFHYLKENNIEEWIKADLDEGQHTPRYIITYYFNARGLMTETIRFYFLRRFNKMKLTYDMRSGQTMR